MRCPRLFCYRFLIPICSISLSLLSVSAAMAEPNFDRDILPYLKNHCMACHNEQKQEGEFRVDNLSKQVGTKDTALWAEVRERISSGEMPPEEAKNKPTADQSTAVVQWLSARFKEGEAARMAKRHPVTFYKLSRQEYANTVYDLLGVHYDVDDPTGFSEDDNWHGFERIGSVLTLSASHVEKYIAAAEAVLAEAYPDRKVEPFQMRKRAIDLRGGPSKEKIKQLTEQGLIDKVRVDMWPGHMIQGGRPGPQRRLQVAGVYKVRLQVSGLQPAGGRAPHLEFAADKLDRTLFEKDIVASEDQPELIEFTTHLPAGNHTFRVRNDVPGPSILPRSGRSGRKPFFSLKEGRIPWQLKLTDEEGQPLYPFLILDWIEWEGPVITDAELAKRASFMPAEEKNMQQVRECLKRFARLAFRRPVKEEEIQQYVKLVEDELAAGEKFTAAMKTALLAVMCSKDFVYLVEGTPDKNSQYLSDHELASRLSYFLWSTMPDDQLSTLATKGVLHKPEVLRQEVARLLADPKGRRFVETFPYQWLQLKKVGMFPPDAKLYPEYDLYLEKSMIRETTSFFGEVLDKNLTLREFLDSKWTMLNPRLAMHYGIPGVTKDEFQRVTLKPEDHRGGLLTQAAILSLTSDGTRHRPVHRGVWLSESIFGKSPPPPPANVDAIEPNPVDAPKATLRMKLEAHKSNANCASCHRGIDPLGLAFDNYDAIGSWRTEEKVQRGTGANPKVDASGELPDGRKFTGADDFKQLLLDDLDRFNETFVEKLATFGLRRTLTFEDHDQLATIAKASKASDYQVRAIIEAFVLSELFRKR